MESFREIYSQTEDKDDLSYMDERKDNFPVNISFTVERNQKTGLPFIAEKGFPARFELGIPFRCLHRRKLCAA